MVFDEAIDHNINLSYDGKILSRKKPKANTHLTNKDNISI